MPRKADSNRIMHENISVLHYIHTPHHLRLQYGSSSGVHICVLSTPHTPHTLRLQNGSSPRTSLFLKNQCYLGLDLGLSFVLLLSPFILHTHSPIHFSQFCCVLRKNKLYIVTKYLRCLIITLTLIYKMSIATTLPLLGR